MGCTDLWLSIEHQIFSSEKKRYRDVYSGGRRSLSSVIHAVPMGLNKGEKVSLHSFADFDESDEQYITLVQESPMLD